MAILATGVTKVSGKVADTNGEVVLTAADVGAAASTRNYGGDLNNLTISGFYSLHTGVLNAPSSRSGLGDQLTHHQWDNNAANQTYLAHNTKQMWFRHKVVGNWSSWTEVYHAANVVGSGGIIERGSNANGEYVKFADGTMICTGTVVVAANTYTSVWTFPVAFSATPMCHSLAAGAASGVNAGVFVNEHSSTSSTSLTVKTLLVQVGAINQIGTNTSSRVTAIGRWK